LGQIKGKDKLIYENIGIESSATPAGNDHTNRVYYIKKQAKAGNDTFYLISTKTSSTKGTIGWDNSKDIKKYSHKAIDTNSKTCEFKVKGEASDRSWRGPKNKIYNSNDFAKMEGDAFNVHKTETVGNNTWYRGDYQGKRIWVHENHLIKK